MKHTNQKILVNKLTKWNQRTTTWHSVPIDYFTIVSPSENECLHESLNIWCRFFFHFLLPFLRTCSLSTACWVLLLFCIKVCTGSVLKTSLSAVSYTLSLTKHVINCLTSSWTFGLTGRCLQMLNIEYQLKHIKKHFHYSKYMNNHGLTIILLFDCLWGKCT